MLLIQLLLAGKIRIHLRNFLLLAMLVIVARFIVVRVIGNITRRIGAIGVLVPIAFVLTLVVGAIINLIDRIETLPALVLVV